MLTTVDNQLCNTETTDEISPNDNNLVTVWTICMELYNTSLEFSRYNSLTYGVSKVEDITSLKIHKLKNIENLTLKKEHPSYVIQNQWMMKFTFFVNVVYLRSQGKKCSMRYVLR